MTKPKDLFDEVVGFYNLSNSDVDKADSLRRIAALVGGKPNLDTLAADIGFKRTSPNLLLHQDPYWIVDYGLSFIYGFLELVNLRQESVEEVFVLHHDASVSKAEFTIKHPYHTDMCLMYPHLGNMELQRTILPRLLAYPEGSDARRLLIAAGERSRVTPFKRKRRWELDTFNRNSSEK